jgi:hypothetical protein
MKKFIIFLAMLFTLAANATPRVINESIIQNFNKVFPEAQNVKWYNATTYYSVHFNDEEVICTIIYGLDGNVIETYRYYSDVNKLCPFVSSKILSKYRNKSVIGITEIHTASALSYQIILQDEKYMYVVNCDSNGFMHPEKKYIKG